MDNEEAAIGVIDSGVGGLTVVKELMRQLPRERIIYYGDSLRCPYGPRSMEEVKHFTFGMIRFLSTHPLKMVVIACNTATAVALKDVQEMLDIPVVGVIHPGARAAIKVTKGGRIGVIGTQGTIQSGAYPKALKQIHPHVNVTSLACPTLVPLVESGKFISANAIEVIKEALLPLQKEPIDCLILGCTHYPVLSDLIRRVVGDQMTLISSAEETAREVSAVLSHRQLLSRALTSSLNHFYTSGDTGLFQSIAQAWLEQDVDVTSHDWINPSIKQYFG